MAAVAVLATNVGLVQLTGVQQAHAVTSLVFAEGFDGVTPPTLPAGWTATRAAGLAADQTWQTSTPGLVSDPNSASVGAHGHVTDMIVESVPFVAGSATRVSFFQKYILQATTGQFGGDAVDGGVLEIKIGSAGYVDFLAAGGSFNAGEGYTRRITDQQNNPLGGRMGWSGTSLGSTHNGTLPSSASGQTVRLRWRLGTSDHTANQAGTGFFQPQAWIIDSVNIFTDTGSADQTISFTSAAPANPHKGDSYTPTATATSGLPVTLSIAAGSISVCTLRGTVVDFRGEGLCVIQANQAGNSTYNPAPQQIQTVIVVKFTDTIFFTSTAPVNAQVGSTYTPTVRTAYFGRTVTFSIASASGSVCSINPADNLVTFNAVGPCVIQADEAGDADFTPAAQVAQTVNVVGGGPTSQTISFTSTAPVNPAVGATYTPTATATSGLPVTLSIASGSSSVCSIGAADLVTFNTTGSCVIQADQAGNGSFTAAPQVTQAVTVVKANQTITFSAPGPRTLGDAPFTVSATSTSGLRSASACPAAVRARSRGPR